MKTQIAKAGAAVGVLIVASGVNAQSINLNSYYLAGTYNLPLTYTPATPTGTAPIAFEASAVTWNRDTNTLFMLGDGGRYVMQTSLSGVEINRMDLATGLNGTASQNPKVEFWDPEGLAYIGNGKFIMTEERFRTAVQFTYAPGTTLGRADTQTIKLGTTVGNTGLEGITYDPTTPNNFILVNEVNGSGASQNIFQTTLNFSSLTASNGSATTVNAASLFPVANIGYTSLNDVYAMANSSYAASLSAGGNLLVLTNTGGLKEITRAGVVLSSRTLPYSNTTGPQIEGVTMDDNGLLYLVSDNGDFVNSQIGSSLFVYAPIPEPTEVALMLAGLGVVGAVTRKREKKVA
jgi:uncharacterized protein YjiK